MLWFDTVRSSICRKTLSEIRFRVHILVVIVIIVITRVTTATEVNVPLETNFQPILLGVWIIDLFIFLHIFSLSCFLSHFVILCKMVSHGHADFWPGDSYVNNQSVSGLSIQMKLNWSQAWLVWPFYYKEQCHVSSGARSPFSTTVNGAGPQLTISCLCDSDLERRWVLEW